MELQKLEHDFLDKYGYDESINMDSDATFYVISGSEADGSDLKQELHELIAQAFQAGKDTAVEYIKGHSMRKFPSVYVGEKQDMYEQNEYVLEAARNA